jgi:hypothetical protein
MNDSPGWAAPGSSPSDEPGPDSPGQDPAQGQPGQSAPDGRTAPPVSWSKQQPPPGQWTAPTAPGPVPPGGQGPGGPAGWGYGWAQPPVAAKPGVIPLRPLGIGEILDGTVSTVRAHWRTVLGISLAVAVLTQTAETLGTLVWYPDTAALESLQNNPAPAPEEVMTVFKSTFASALISSAVTGLIGILGTLVATAMLTIVVSRAVLGRSVSIGEAWREAKPQLFRLLGLLFLVPLIIVAVIAVALLPGILLSVTGADQAGLLLALGALAAVIIAIWIGVRFSLATPALMLEKQKVIASLRRSAKLIRGAWWRVFGIELLAGLLVLIVAAIIEIPTTLIAGAATGDSPTSWTLLTITGIGAVISSTVTLPFSAGVTVLLYVDQRIRREALDLELARAAGVTGPVPHQPGYAQPHDPTPGS